MDAPGSTRLTNDDFRKLLMTPRLMVSETPTLPSSYATPTTALSSAAGQGGASLAMGSGASGHLKLDLGSLRKSSKKSTNIDARKKKKSVYAALKREEDLRLAELADKYRDRAKERREKSDTGIDLRDPINITAYK